MSTITTLSDAQKGRPYIINGFTDPSSEYAEKLLKMGFVEGTVVSRSEVEINDPMIFVLRHARVALRKKEAQEILVRKA